MADTDTTFYRYTDENGTEHFVTSLKEVPAAFRKQAKPVTTQVTIEHRTIEQEVGDQASLRALQAEALAASANRGLDSALQKMGWAGHVHLPSVGLGAGVTLALVLVWSLVKHRSGRVFKLGALIGVFALVAIGYLSWIQSAVGLSKGGIATPQTMLDSAREAAEAAKVRAQKQEEVLKSIDEEPGRRR